MKDYLYYLILFSCLFSLSCKNRPAGSHHDPENMAGFDTARVSSLNRYAMQLVQKDPDSAIFYLNKSLQQSVAMNYRLGTGEALYVAGIAHFYKYLYDTALYLHRKSYQIFEEISYKKGMAQAMFSMSYDYSLKQDMLKSLECMEKSRSLLEEVQDYSRVFDCIEGLVFLHKQLNHPREVDSLIKEMVLVAEKTGDKRKLANSYYNLGSYYVDQAYLNLAIEAFYKALKIAEESGSEAEIANAMGSIALANFYLGEYQAAIDYYLKQEAILKNRKDNYLLSNTYAGLGEAYNSLGDHTNGLSYHEKSLAIRKDMNYQMAISHSLHHIGYTYFLMGNLADEALQYVNQSLLIDKRIRNHEGMARNYMLSGKIHARNKDYSAAIEFLEKSLDLARQYRYSNVILDASGELSRLYAAKGNYEKAFANKLVNDEISDSLTSGENFKRITQLEMQHAFDKRQNEAEVSHREERMKYETAIKRNKLVRNYSLLLGSLIIVFGIFMFYSYRKSRKADKEKEALLKEIHHRVKNNLMVISSLLNLQSGSITDDNTRSAVKESQSRVKSMALIHQLLYQSEMFSSIDFPKYLEQLMASLQSAYCKPGMNINYSIKAENIRLDIDTAIPLGLITNELATNAYKYAFADSTYGTIEIDLCRTTDHQFLLRVSDNGKGLPREFDLENTSTLGLKLVKILTKQIRAKMQYSSSGGTEFTVVFAENREHNG